MKHRSQIIFSVLYFLFSIFPPAFAQTGMESVPATIRIGKHSNFIRIVFLTSDEYVQKASVILGGDNSIKVDFQSPTIFKTQGKGVLKSKTITELTGGVRITVKGNGCVLTVENLDDINVSKLSTPPRLVIDAHISRPVRGTTEEMAFADIPVEAASIPFELFMIDAGHGGYDSGIRGKNFIEKDFVLSFSKEFSNVLNRKGKRVFLTRGGDQALSIKDRIKVANQKTPEIFISIHLSSKNEFVIYSMPRSSAQVGQQPEKSSGQANKPVQQAAASDTERIANGIANAVKSEFSIKVRLERLPVPVITNANTNAFLIELPNPERFNYDKKIRERFIKAILRGMADPSMQSIVPGIGKGQVSVGGK